MSTVSKNNWSFKINSILFLSMFCYVFYVVDGNTELCCCLSVQFWVYFIFHSWSKIIVLETINMWLFCLFNHRNPCAFTVIESPRVACEKFKIVKLSTGKMFYLHWIHDYITDCVPNILFHSWYFTFTTSNCEHIIPYSDETNH